jgi:16S rRNA G966 N2-methylase RsmD
MKVFEKYPHFILTDPRINRTGAYTVSAEFMQIRHSCLFVTENLKDKTVLDLGACVGATGAWVLEHGAKFYCGVEYHKDLAEIARTNLKSFDSNKWQVLTQSVEDFFINQTQSYDIVIASGLLYAFLEPIPILKNISNCANTIIIESTHAFNRRNLIHGFSDQQLNDITNSPEWLTFIETQPFISYNRQNMLWGTAGEELFFNASAPSMGFIIQYMKTLGFECDLSINDALKNNLPNNYNAERRYAVKLIKTTDEKLSQGFLSATEFKSDVSIRKWSN